LRRELILVLTGLVLGLCTQTFTAIGFDLSFYPGDTVDARLNIYFLEHAFQYFSGQIEDYWNAGFMFPEEGVIAYSDNLLGTALIYGFFRLFGADPFLSFQLWFLALAILNYVAAFHFLKYIFKEPRVAVIGAFVFAFSIALQSQMSHAQVFPRFAIPLAFLFATKFGKDMRPKNFFLAIFFVAFQIYCGIYLGFFLAISLGIYLLFLLADGFGKIRSKLKWLFSMAMALSLNICILLPLIVPYLKRKTETGVDYFGEMVFHTIPLPRSYLYAFQGSYSWNFLSDLPNNLESNTTYFDHQLFAGGMATISFMVVAIMVLYAWIFGISRSTKVDSIRWLILSGIISFFLFMRFREFTAYELLNLLPGFDSFRSVIRIINVMLLFFGVSVSYLLHRIDIFNTTYRNLFFGLLIILLALDNYVLVDGVYRSSVDNAKARTEVLEMELSQLPKGSVISYETTDSLVFPDEFQLDAMLVAQKLGLRSINGYTATSPGDFADFWHHPTRENRNFWLSGKNIAVDSIYVINDKEGLKVLSIAKLKERGEIMSREDKEIQSIANTIRINEDWYMDVRRKAEEMDISVDSMIWLDAKWIYEHRKE